MNSYCRKNKKAEGLTAQLIVLIHQLYPLSPSMSNITHDQQQPKIKPLKPPRVVQWLNAIYPPGLSGLVPGQIQGLYVNLSTTTTTTLTTTTMYIAIVNSTAYQLCQKEITRC